MAHYPESKALHGLMSVQGFSFFVASHVLLSECL